MPKNNTNDLEEINDIYHSLTSTVEHLNTRLSLRNKAGNLGDGELSEIRKIADRAIVDLNMAL